MRRATIFAALLALAACDVSPRETNHGEFEPAKLAYFKDARTGICYSVSSWTRFDSGLKVSSGMSHTAVPCSPEVERLVIR